MQPEMGQLVTSFLYDLRKAIGDRQGCIYEAVDAVCQASFTSGVQLWAWFVNAFFPADFHEVVHLDGGKPKQRSSNYFIALKT